MALKTSYDAVSDNDLVLVYIEDQPAFFARVEGFTPDHKPNWWHVKLLILNLPLRVVTWILRLEQLNGEEPFTMGGTPIRIEKVEMPVEKPNLGGSRPDAQDNPLEEEVQQAETVQTPNRQARILSLGGQKKASE
ncbi:MAG: hypothetical protein ACE5I1_16720 [bacterium]